MQSQRSTASVARTVAYAIVGVALWLCVLRSGVHATLAGVVIGLTIPLVADRGRSRPLERIENALRPRVAYAILPLFAFANAGVKLGSTSFATLIEPLPLGIAAGLFLGKQLGVFDFAAVNLGLFRLPDRVSWVGIYGVALLAGVGFTMSLFTGKLAFGDQAMDAGLRIGVLAGSSASALAGYPFLRAFLPAPLTAPMAQE